MIIDNKVETEPLVWEVSKVNRLNPSGVIIVTLAQTHYNAQTDYIERDEETGEIIGMWADWFSSSIAPKDFSTEINPNIHGEITYAGKDAVIKIGGSYKKFTITFYDGDEALPFEDFDGGEWTYTIDEVDASDLLEVISDEPNQQKIKFIGSRTYLGSILKIKYSAPIGIDTEIDVEVKAL